MNRFSQQIRNLFLDRHGGISMRGVKISVILICLLAVIAHLPLLFGNFINYDDGRWIFRNEDIKNSSWDFIKNLFYTSYKNVDSTPMFLTFALNWKISPNYTGFAVFNLAWLVLTIVVYFRFSGLFFEQAHWRLLATLLFAMHTVKTDVVAWMSSRCHLLGMVFFLGAFIAWQHYRNSLFWKSKVFWYAAAIGFGELAVVNKNIFLAVFPLLGLYDLYKRSKLNWRFFLDKIPLIIALFLPLYISHRYSSAIGRTQLPSLESRFWEVLINNFNLLVQYALHLFVPLPTSASVNVYKVKGLFEISPDASLIAMRFTPAASAAILVIMISVAIYLLRRFRAAEPLLAIMGTVVALIPVLNFIPFWDELAFRYNWIPLTLFCIAFVRVFSLALTRLSSKARLIAGIIFSFYIGWHSVCTFIQSTYWGTEEKYWKTCLKNYPDSTICAYKLARKYQNKQPGESIKYFQIIDRLYTERNMTEKQSSGYNLAICYEALGDKKTAAFYYEQALLRDNLKADSRKKARTFLDNFHKDKNKDNP